MPMGIGPGLSVTRFESGIPGWMTGMDLGWDWVSNSKYNGAVDPTDTHSAAINAQFAAGGWSPFAANTLVRTDLGLQTVPTRTNLFTYSQQFDNVAWTKAAATVTANQAVSPDGTTTADLVVASTGNSIHYTGQSITSTASGYAVSVFVKPSGAYQKVGFREDTVTGAYATFSLTGNGAVISTGAGGSGSIEVAANGFYRITMTYTGTAASHRPTLYFMDNSYVSGSPLAYSWAGDGTTGYYVWQGQYELGAFASPPIVTTSSSATVNGNQQVVDLTGRLSAGVGGILQFNPLNVTATFKQPISFNDGTSNNYLNVYMDTGGGTPLSQIVNATINQGNVTMPGANATGVQTWVIAAGPNYHRTQKIGQAASTTDTTVSWPTTLSKMNIGGNGYSAADNMYQLTRRLALRFGTANDAMFNELVAKATILNAVS